MVAMWLASHPTVPDFSCGFQPHLSSGTRSSVVRVFFISWSNSGGIDCPIVIEPPRREGLGVVGPGHRRKKGELSRAFLRPCRFDACVARGVAEKIGEPAQTASDAGPLRGGGRRGRQFLPRIRRRGTIPPCHTTF